MWLVLPAAILRRKGGAMKILLAYDGPERSGSALASAAELGRADGAEITVLGVTPPGEGESRTPGRVVLRPRAHPDVVKAHAHLRGLGIASTMRMEQGHPAGEIVRVAEEGGYELIVVGSRGRSPVGELLLGSVSRSVVRRAPCPVLVAAADADQRFEPTSAV
jgi:nucleotide-binding universal stress UspA family protein